MSINHHVSDELLLRYASGELAEGWSLAVATHLALCPSCRQRLSKMETIGGALREHFDQHGIRRCLGSNAQQDREGGNGRFAADGRPPAGGPCRADLAGAAAFLSRRRYRQPQMALLGMGAYQIPIQLADTSTIARLLRIPAGKPVPEHGHAGQELTLVLAGSFRDGSDVFARGDLEEADASLTHQPLASEGEDCICLAVTDAPLKFKSWLVRLIQPVLGI